MVALAPSYSQRTQLFFLQKVDINIPLCLIWNTNTESTSSALLDEIDRVRIMSAALTGRFSVGRRATDPKATGVPSIAFPSLYPCDNFGRSKQRPLSALIIQWEGDGTCLAFPDHPLFGFLRGVCRGGRRSPLRARTDISRIRSGRAIHRCCCSLRGRFFRRVPKYWVKIVHRTLCFEFEHRASDVGWLPAASSDCSMVVFLFDSIVTVMAPMASSK
jgi:hypothetical protein